MTPRLELRDITKSYPGVVANDGICLSILPGEIHAVLGENGAGKSTLMKIIYGAAQADSGEILCDGRLIEVHDPASSRALGIEMVYQHFALFDTKIGLCAIAWGPRGINGTQLPMGGEQKIRTRISQRHADATEAEPTAEVREAIDRIVKLLAGEPDDLTDIELDLEGVPEFNRGVYAIARAIPPGKTITYELEATSAAGVVAAGSRDVTLTITAGS